MNQKNFLKGNTSEAVTINLHNDSHAIPFDKIVEAVNAMERGSTLRIMFEMLFLTGCRMSELDRMKRSMLYGNVLYWSIGKNQTGFRKERISLSYFNELKIYRERNRVYGERLFGIKADTFRRMFNRDIRPKLSAEWQEKRFYNIQGKLQLEYVFQLKGLRKDFQTLFFAKELKKWKDAGVALEFTSKRMKHSSTKITSYHYLENFDSLNINKYIDSNPEQILKQANQKRLLDFGFVNPIR